MLTRLDIIGRSSRVWLDNYLVLVLTSSILGFLSLKGCTNACLILLLVPALTELKPAIQDAKQTRRLAAMRPIMLILAGPFLAVLLSEFFRHEWLFKTLDGPARILLAIPLIFYFNYKQVNFSRLISLCAAPALIILIPIVLSHPEVLEQWGGRFATKAVDPTQFGTYVLVLTAFCLFSIERSAASTPKLLTLQIAGLLAGLYLLAGSGTRGSWLVIPLLILLWAKLKSKALPSHTLIFLLLLFFAGLLLIGLLHPNSLARLFSGYTELTTWLDHSNRETSTGYRLTMWQMTWEFFLRQPFYGYGDTGVEPFLNDPWLLEISNPETRSLILHNGPHNEFLANLLRSGIPGGLAVLGLFFVPTYYFWQNRHQQNCVQACHLGLALMVCLMICSLSSEVLTMKYTATFYGLMVTGLTAQVIRGRFNSNR